MIKKHMGKGTVYLFVALVTGILLIVLSGSFNKEAEALEPYEICEKRCEERLAAILSEVKGVNDVTVLVTLDEVPTGKNRPEIRGVAVVVHGEERSELRLQLVMLISSSLGVTSDKIFVTFS